MSRTIGGLTTWGNNGETWAVTDPTNPSGSTWAVTAGLTDIGSRLLDDPDTAQGVSVGPYASGTLRFVVQVLNPTLGVDSVWGTALWGTGKWSAAVGQWEDASCRVRGVHWHQGLSSSDGKAVVGNATVLLENLDGLVSPYATTGHYVGFNSRSWVRAGLFVRWGILKTASLAAGLPALATFEPIFTGRVEAANETTLENTDSAVELTIIETTADLAPYPADQQTYGGRALSATIMDAITASGWPYQTSLTVPSEETTVPATTLSGGSAAQRVDQLTEGKHWDWFADGRGRVMLARRHQAESASGIVFANKVTVPATAGVYPAVTMVPYANTERLINTVSAARINGAGDLITREDTRARAQFGTISNRYGFPRSDIVLETDAEVQALGDRIIGFRAWDDIGIGEIDLDADQDAVNLPALMTYLAAHAREGVSFVAQWTHPAGTVLTETVLIEGQTHDIVPLGKPGVALKWTCSLMTGHSGPVSEA